MAGYVGAEPGSAGRPGGRPGAWLAAAALLALALRLAFGLVYWVEKPLTLDEQEYLLLARSLASGRGFAYPPAIAEDAAVVHFERPPAYPALLAAALVATNHPWAERTGRRSEPVAVPRSSSDVPRVIPVVQALLGAVGVWLIGLIAWRAAGPRAAVVAAVLAAIEPPLVWICGYVLNEAVYSVMAMATAWLLMRAWDGRGRAGLGTGFAAGCVAGIAVLTKEGMIFFLPLAGLWLLASRRLALAAAMTAGVLVVLAPWVVRNYAVHGRFVLTAAHGGVTFWTGNNPMARGEGDLAANPDMKRARLAIERRYAGRSPQDMDQVYYREAFAFICDHPLSWLALETKKLFYTLVPIGPSYFLHSTRYRLGSWLPYALLVPVAIAGIVRLGRATAALWPVLLLVLSVVGMNLVFFPQERFRIPVVDPALIVCAAACMATRRTGDRVAPVTP